MQYHPSDTLLENRIILVTGAASELGRLAALTFAKYGAIVVLLDHPVNHLETLYDEIINKHYPQPAIYPCNLGTASPHDFDELAIRLRKEFGRLDGILHHATLFHGLTPIENYDLRRWYETLQVDLNAPFLLTRAVLPLLKQSIHASVLFIEDHDCNHAYWGAYGVAKAGLREFRQILADELENTPTIRINSIYPGKLKTDLQAKAYHPDALKNYSDPNDVMPAYLYLMSAASQHLHNRCLNAQALPETDDTLFASS